MPFENIGQGLKHLLCDSDIDLKRIIEKPNVICRPVLQHILEKRVRELTTNRSSIRKAAFSPRALFTGLSKRDSLGKSPHQ
jgi:hypothetical protein